MLRLLAQGCVCVLFLAMMGCAEGAKEEGRPAHVLAPDTMAALIQQVHIQEAQLQNRRLPARDAKDIFDHQWDSTVRAMGLDTARFSASFLWYTAHVKELDKVYERIGDSLGVEESRANGKPLPAPSTREGQNAGEPDHH